MPQASWHSSKIDRTFEILNSSSEGLSQEEASKRLEEGKNKIEEGKKKSPLRIFLSQFKDFLIFILIVAAIISFLVGHQIDTYLILAIVIANGVFGFFQNWKAEKSIKALKEMASPEATVRRGGEKKKINSEEVVPGDILILEQGDSIAADARLIEQHNLKTDESALTGESSSVDKNTKTLEKDVELAERKNMVYKHTNVVRGRGEAVVVGTGMDTEIGKVATKLQEVEKEDTPFQKEVNDLGQKIGGIILGICAIIVPMLVLLHGTSILESFLTAIALAVAAVPEGLPAVVTLTLAIGTKKMVKRNALVRKLPVVESLGSVDVICTDKTGTLTEGNMVVEKIYFNEDEVDVNGGFSYEGKFMKDGEEMNPKELEMILKTGMLCNNSNVQEKEVLGDPTEVALIYSAKKAGLNKENLEEDYKRTDEIPFSSKRKQMTTIHEKDGEKTAFVKGAPEVVLDECDRYWKDGDKVELTDSKKEEFLEKNKELANEAMRVLAFAYKDMEEVGEDDEIESGLVFLGLQGMMDPPRKEVKNAINDCRDAGIRTVMVTGDNAVTAKAVGRQLGFEGNVLTGNDIDSMSDKELEERVEEIDIYARVSPSHKVEILDALKENEHTVAMTGDGVNDAPSVKRADVGISMGKRGTDIAQQASDMVLLDDNYNSIRDAVAEGRGIFNNIRKFVNLLLSANVGEVLVVFIASLVGLGLPLTAVMLLWINLLTDGLPALAIGADPKSEKVMNKKPRSEDEGVINNRVLFTIAGIGTTITLFVLLIFKLGLPDMGKARTLAFTSLVLFELLEIQPIRSRYDTPLTSNKWLGFAVASSVILQLVVLYSPLNQYFGVVPLGLSSWLLILAFGAAFCAIMYLLIEIEEKIFEE